MLNVLRMAAVNSGVIISNYFETVKNIETREKTSHRDLVTKVDEESQEEIRKTIVKNLMMEGVSEEEIGAIGEEKLNENGKHMFVIDPLDGTTNFVSGLPFFGISIAYAHRGRIQSGVIYNPIDRTLYSAEVGLGAWVERGNEKRELKIEPVELKNCLVFIHADSSNAWKKVESLYPAVRGVRNIGSIVLQLGFLAEGIYNIGYNSKCYVWDIAAASIIISEAGGIIADMDGKDWIPDLTNTRKPLEVVAGHKDKIGEILRRLNS
jgi:myo-inositol-1(or 4)-monophosphatase